MPYQDPDIFQKAELLAKFSEEILRGHCDPTGQFLGTTGLIAVGVSDVC